jgi:hypothetical protein
MQGTSATLAKSTTLGFTKQPFQGHHEKQYKSRIEGTM